MRELSTERIKFGEHILIDGVEYVAEEGGGCEECPMTEGGSALCGLCPIGGHIVKVKKEPKYRPYKDTDEMIADWKERFGAKDCPSHSMPLIWVRLKSGTNATYLVYGYLQNGVAIGVARPSFLVLLEDYTYLDGSPCGKEVTE